MAHARYYFAAALSVVLAAKTYAAPAWPEHLEAEAQALNLAESSIRLHSVHGQGNRTGDVANLFRDALVNGGYAPGDVTITLVDDTAYLVAIWRGSNLSLRPLVISGHMDVVAADPADWERDPFTPVVEGGYLYGRGATDMKLDDALVLASLIELKRQGYQPARSIIVAFSGDEETTMKTSRVLADQLANAEFVLNVDVGAGVTDEKSGKPLYFSWGAAEKGYADITLTVTSSGGHSSMPRPDNAIVQLARAVERIDAHHFAPQVNAVSRAHLEAVAKLEPDPKLAGAIRAFLTNPADPDALAILRADPTYVGYVGTTCVPTMIKGGHAENALPQRATANINCRIFPGTEPAAVMAELEQVADDPTIHFNDVTEEGTRGSRMSPMRADFTAAVEKAIHAVYPGVPVFPSIDSGATDNMHYRARGVTAYSASPIFLKASEDFSHGLNERTPLANIRPSINYFLILVRELTK
jgi:carboxypeptidase PM20D1